MRVLRLRIFERPYSYLLAAGALAAAMCLFPAGTEKTQQESPAPAQTPQLADGQTGMEQEAPQEQPVGADLSERTGSGCLLHRTIRYAQCSHSVQRREDLPAQLRGLTRTALEKELPGVVPGAVITGFSSSEVDIAVRLPMPCPLHWVLRGGEDGMLHVMQNLSGEAMEAVRKTDVPLSLAAEEDRQALLAGMVFDDVQALEGYRESLSS